MNTQNHDRYLTTREICEKYAVSPSSLRRWEKEGHIDAVRTPGKYKRFHEGAIRSTLQIKDNVSNDSSEVTFQEAHMTTEDHDQYLSTREICEKYSVSPSSLRRWEKEGFITAVRTPGGYKRFHEGEFRKAMGIDDTPKEKSFSWWPFSKS